MYKYYLKLLDRKIAKQTAEQKISNTEDDSQRMCFFTTFPVVFWWNVSNTGFSGILSMKFKGSLFSCPRGSRSRFYIKLLLKCQGAFL